MQRARCHEHMPAHALMAATPSIDAYDASATFLGSANAVLVAFYSLVLSCAVSPVCSSSNCGKKPFCMLAVILHADVLLLCISCIHLQQTALGHALLLRRSISLQVPCIWDQHGLLLQGAPSPIPSNCGGMSKIVT